MCVFMLVTWSVSPATFHIFYSYTSSIFFFCFFATLIITLCANTICNICGTSPPSAIYHNAILHIVSLSVDWRNINVSAVTLSRRMAFGRKNSMTVFTFFLYLFSFLFRTNVMALSALAKCCCNYMPNSVGLCEYQAIYLQSFALYYIV